MPSELCDRDHGEDPGEMVRSAQRAIRSWLTRQGQFGTEVIVVLKGTASVDISGTVVAELGAGEVIGEMSLLDHGPRTATITATSPMEVAALSIKAFDDLAKQSPALWRAIATGLARRLREEDRSYHN